MIATTLSNLRRALRFATKVLGVPAFFVLTDEQGLGEALCHHFRLPGMTPQSLKSDAIRAILDGGAAADRAVA